ncbi:MAG: hypothetical protein QM487_13545 [Candidatus Marithrix sp.]
MKYEVLGHDDDKVFTNATFKSLGFGKRKIKCKLKYWNAITPAGPIIYPLLLTKNNKSIRPVTIDGLHGTHKEGNITLCVLCMLTPISQGKIIFETKDIKSCSNGYIECECLLESDGNPFESIFAIETKNKKIKLFHHTSEQNAQLIHESSRLKGSKYSLLGTNELTYCNYLYFTDHEIIQDAFDLMDIGMANEGTQIKICTDDGKNIEECKVYREEAGNRTHTLSIWVDPEIISPPPLILHEPNKFSPPFILHEPNKFSGDAYSWWEIFHNSIFRVPIKAGSYLPINHISEYEYILETNDNLLPLEGFNAGHGMDITSMKTLLTEPSPENHPRKNNLTKADSGIIDKMWVETWEKNLSKFAEKILNNILK